MSPMVMLGHSPFTVGLCSEQKTKNADLEEETNTGLSYNMSNEEKQLGKSPTVCVCERGYDGITLTGDVWEHWGPSSSSASSPCLSVGCSSSSPDRSGPYPPSPDLQTSSSQLQPESKHTHTHVIPNKSHNNQHWCVSHTHTQTFHRSEQVLENLAKFTGVPGLFLLCSSRQERTKKAYAEVRPLGLFTSFTMAATKHTKLSSIHGLYGSMQDQFP